MAPKKRRRQNKHRWFGESESAFLSEETRQNINEGISILYNKKYTLKSKETSWELPDPKFLFTSEIESIDELMEIKQSLNETKSLLNDIDIVKWHQHTRRSHKAGLVVKRLRETLHAEMCTQAFAKVYEVLATYDLVQQEAVAKESVFSVHLCEAPGAFVAAMNHYLKNHHPGLTWEWIATTLNPYYEGHSLKALLDDDRFILETIDNWDFGVDGTGDLMSLENLEGLQQACKARGTVHLVTADGSIDCADEPAEQENSVSQLIFCEAVAALALLGKGGCFVFKMFTALEHAMICLMYLVACLFDEVHIIKPGTSKAGNSEVYVACCGYEGALPEQYQELLHSVYKPHCPDKAMFPLSEIPTAFLDSLKEYQRYFIDLQIQEIETNIEHFHHMSNLEKKQLFHLRNEASNCYIDNFGVKPIEDEDRIVTGAYLDGTQLSYTRGPSNDVPIVEPFCGRSKTGSYNERQELQHRGWLESVLEDGVFACFPAACITLQGLSHTNQGAKLVPLSPLDIAWLTMPITPLQDSQWVEILQTSKGKALDQVRNSRFCTPAYISRLDEAKENSAVLNPEHLEDLNRIAECMSPGHIACHLNNKGHHCDVSSIVALDKLVAFTDVRGENSIVEISRGSTACDCLFLYLQSRNLTVKFTSEDGCRMDVSTSTCTPPMECKTKPDYQTYQSPQSEDLPGLYISVFNTDTTMSPTQSIHTSLELISREYLVKECIQVLKRLRRGGTFVCQLYDCLTRFTVGIIYILHHVFSQFAIVKPVVSSLWHPQRYLVCRGYQGCPEGVMTHLEQVLADMKMVNVSQRIASVRQAVSTVSQSVTVSTAIETLPAANQTVSDAQDTLSAAQEAMSVVNGTVPAAHETVPDALGTVSAALEAVSAAHETMPAALGTLSSANQTVSAAQETVSAAQEPLSSAQETMSLANGKLSAANETVSVDQPQPGHLPVSTVNQALTCVNRIKASNNNLGEEISDSPKHHDILEIVPVYHLYENRFYQFIKKVNEQLVHLQLHNIIKLEMFYTFPETFPEEGKDQLSVEIAEYLGI